MKKILACMLIFLCLPILGSGCGYTTSSALPGNFKTIYIEAFKNSISYTSMDGRNLYIPLLEVKARNAVVDRFLFDGNLRVAKSAEADLVLKGELKGYQRDELRTTDNDDTLEYRVRIKMFLQLINTSRQELEWQTTTAGEATYFVSGSEASTEESAIDEAIMDLARRIVERTIENW